MKDLMLPRGYLSHSAMSLYKSDHNRFFTRYFEGGDDELSTQEIDFGSMFAEHLQSGKKTGDPVFDTVLATVPKYKHSEHEVRAVLPHTTGNIPLLIKLDTYNPTTHAFADYKTGRTKWTHAKVQSSEQMKFYTTALYLKHGVYDQEKSIVWLETEMGESVRFTGHTQQLKFTMTLPEILRYSQVIARTALQISEDYKTYIKQLV